MRYIYCVMTVATKVILACHIIDIFAPATLDPTTIVRHIILVTMATSAFVVRTQLAKQGEHAQSDDRNPFKRPNSTAANTKPELRVAIPHGL